jgi:hypothetical protein
MTHFPPPPPPPFPSSPAADRACPGPLRSRFAAQPVRDPGELVAAMPGLLGFHPQMSMLLVALRGPDRQIDLVVRSNLPDPVPERADLLEQFATHVVASLLRAEPDAAAIVLVSAEAVDAAPEAVAVVAERLREVGIPLHSSTWASGTRAGDSWRCWEACGCGGEVPAGAAGAFAAGAALGGVVVHDDREALLELVEPTDHAGVERRERLMAAAIDRYSVTGGAPDPMVGWAAVVRAVVDCMEGSLVLDDERVVALAVALGAPEVVDTALAWMAVRAEEGDEQQRAAAEQLWAALSREAPEPEAAVPASLLAAAALLRGDGALANVALDRAQEAWPGYLLSLRLRAIAALGIRPEEFRDGVLANLTRRR